MRAGEWLPTIFWRAHGRVEKGGLGQRWTPVAFFWRTYAYKPSDAQTRRLTPRTAATAAAVIVAVAAGIVIGRHQVAPTSVIAAPAATIAGQPTAALPAATTSPTASSPPVKTAPQSMSQPPQVAQSTPRPLVDRLITGPKGYGGDQPVVLDLTRAARLGSEEKREEAALRTAGFEAGVLQRWASPGGADTFAALVYEFASEEGAHAFLEHSVEDFTDNVKGSTAFDPGVVNSAGFASNASASHYVFVYMRKGPFVFALTSGGRSDAHTPQEGRALAAAQSVRG